MLHPHNVQMGPQENLKVEKNLLNDLGYLRAFAKVFFDDFALMSA